MLQQIRLALLSTGNLIPKRANFLGFYTRPVCCAMLVNIPKLPLRHTTYIEILIYFCIYGLRKYGVTLNCLPNKMWRLHCCGWWRDLIDIRLWWYSGWWWVVVNTCSPTSLYALIDRFNKETMVSSFFDNFFISFTLSGTNKLYCCRFRRFGTHWSLLQYPSFHNPQWAFQLLVQC